MSKKPKQSLVEQLKPFVAPFRVDGCLNEVTSQPCGLTPSNTLLIALSLPAASIP